MISFLNSFKFKQKNNYNYLYTHRISKIKILNFQPKNSTDINVKKSSTKLITNASSTNTSFVNSKIGYMGRRIIPNQISFLRS